MGSLLIKKLIAHARPMMTARRVGGSHVRVFTNDNHNHSADYNLVEVDTEPSICREISKRLYTARFTFNDAVQIWKSSGTMSMLRLLRWIDQYHPGKFWNMKETAEALYIFRDMSGKIDVTITVEKESNAPAYSVEGIRIDKFGRGSSYRAIRSFPAILVVKFEGDDRGGTIFIKLPCKVFLTDDIKIERENQVVKVTIPKVNFKRIPEFDFGVAFGHPRT